VLPHTGAVTVAGTVAVAVAALLAGCTSSGPGTYDGSCATGAQDRSHVLALDAGSGDERWHRTLTHPRDQAPEAGDRLVLLRGCGLDVLDLATGSTVVHRAAENGLLGLADDRLVTTTGDGDVRADPVTGTGGTGGFVGSAEPPWQHVSLVGRLLLADEAGSLVALDVVSGQESWRAALPTADVTEALAGHGVLVARAGDGSVYRLDPATGAVGWRALPRDGGLGYGRLLALGRRTAVVAAEDPSAQGGRPTTVVGLDLASGLERWRRLLLLTPRAGPAAVAGGTLVLASPPGVRGLDLATGHDMWQVTAASFAPVATTAAVIVDDAASAFAVEPTTGQVLWRRATSHRPLLGADPTGDLVVVLDSPVVAHGMNDCC
jgi:outer membrane protein assembly factor BamB